MSLNATQVTLTPLSIGGAGIIEVQLLESVDALIAYVGPDAAASYNDTNADLVRVVMTPPPTGVGIAQESFWDAEAATGEILTVFTQTGGVWDQGIALTGFNLSPFFSWDFPWDADWVVNRLQDVAKKIQPLPNKTVRITRAFPRDTHGWPAINVQVDALNPMATMVGDMMAGLQTGSYQTDLTKGKLWTLQLSLVGWCETPEQRSALGPWMGGAMEVVLAAARALGWADPVISYKESEDFETLGVPAFLVTANLTVTVQSTLQDREINDYGMGTGAEIDPNLLIPIRLSATIGLAGEDGFTATIDPISGATLEWSLANGYILEGQGTESISFALGEGHQTCVVSLTATDSAGNSAHGAATVAILPQPESTTWTTSTLVYQGEASQLIDLGGAFLINEMAASSSARVRVYDTQSHMLADAARIMGLLPTAGSGLIAEAILGGGILDAHFKPYAYGAPGGQVWVLVDDLSPTGITTITVTISALRLE